MPLTKEIPMSKLHPSVLGIARICLVTILIAMAVSVVVPGSVSWRPALADNGGDDDDDDKGDDNSGHGGNHDDGGDHGEDHNDDRNEDKEKDKEDKKGKGNGENVVVVVAPNVTPIPVPTAAPTPSPTAAPETAGTLRVVAMSCSATPAAGADWASACTLPVDRAHFKVKALDGPLAEWFREIRADASGVAMLASLPPARYQLEQVSADWCRAESDRVDTDGDVVIAEGQVTTVWTYNCNAPPTGGS